MKKLSIILIGAIFVLSTTGWALAQEKTKPGKAPEAAKPGESTKAAESAQAQAPKPVEAKPEVAKPEKAKKETPAKSAEYRMGGIVTAIDVGRKKITIKQQRVKRERMVTLMMSEKTAKELSNIKVGDPVNVWVKGKRITALQKVS